MFFRDVHCYKRKILISILISAHSHPFQIIAQHQNMVIANSQRTIKNYTLLSNDNAFLSYYPYQFLQRTLMARFQINNTSPPYVTFIRKPIYCLMSLLALMGDKQVHAHATGNT